MLWVCICSPSLLCIIYNVIRYCVALGAWFGRHRMALVLALACGFPAIAKPPAGRPLRGRRALSGAGEATAQPASRWEELTLVEAHSGSVVSLASLSAVSGVPPSLLPLLFQLPSVRDGCAPLLSASSCVPSHCGSQGRHRPHRSFGWACSVAHGVAAVRRSSVCMPRVA